jgi:DNA polymerase-3 subunit alpha
LGIEVLPPDINESDVKFTVVNGKVRFGMAAVKNVGEAAVREIIYERREHGFFINFMDFCQRIDGKDVNKRCIESLIKSGSFDSLGVFRSKLIAVYEKVIDGIQQNRKRNLEGQMSLFDIKGPNDKDVISESYPDIKEYPGKMLLSMEKEMLGLYISGHPLSEYEEELKQNVTLFSSDLNAETQEGDDTAGSGENRTISDGMPVVVGGLITEKKTKTTKSNNLMAFITLEDLFGTMEIIVFPTILSRYSGLITEENPVLVHGRISQKEEEQPKIICDEVTALKKMNFKKLYIKINNTENNKAMSALKAFLKFFNGNTPVYLYSDEQKTVEIFEKDCWINLNDAVLEELCSRYGEDNVKVV